jgi:hypothetical protein
MEVDRKLRLKTVSKCWSSLFKLPSPNTSEMYEKETTENLSGNSQPHCRQLDLCLLDCSALG